MNFSSSKWKEFFKRFIRVNYVQLMMLLLVLTLALLSGAIYFQFEKIVASQNRSQLAVVKGFQERKQGIEKAETPEKNGESKRAGRIESPTSTPPTKSSQAQKGSSESEQPSQSLQAGEAQPPSGTASPSSSQKETIKVELVLDHGTIKTYFMEVPKGTSVYDLLKEASTEHNFSLEVSYDPAYGAFIEEIDGIRNNSKEGKYWLYYLNGRLANMGASSQKLSPGDKVLWKYERSR